MSLRADVLAGDCRVVLAALPAASVQCVATSPPYWGLRDYGFNGQLGLEPTPELYVAHMVEIFRAVRRVLRDDGTVWLNLGDSYNGSASTGGTNSLSGGGTLRPNGRSQVANGALRRDAGDLKPKDLVGIPWRVAFALQADGWYLRADVIWAKPNPMPESVTDRPTKAHEYVFLLTKRERYFYDAEAVKEPLSPLTISDPRQIDPDYTEIRIRNRGGRTDGFTSGSGLLKASGNGRNLRSVWTIATQPYPEAHFATFPEALVVPCVRAGTSEYGACAQCGAPWVRVVEREAAERRRDYGLVAWNVQFNNARAGSITTTTIGWRPTCACDAEVMPCTVLDPFAGSGTVLLVANQLGRHALGIEANPAYVTLAERRLVQRALV